MFFLLNMEIIISVQQVKFYVLSSSFFFPFLWLEQTLYTSLSTVMAKINFPLWNKKKYLLLAVFSEYYFKLYALYTQHVVPGVLQFRSRNMVTHALPPQQQQK